MRLLFIGDIVGRPGRDIVRQQLPKLREDLRLDFVIANAENAAAGAGLTAKIAHELLACQIDGITLGDHAWDQRGFAEAIKDLEKVCRPANLPPQCPGRRSLVLEHASGYKLGVFTVLGRSFMKIQADCPFRCADDLTRELRDQCDGLMVEVHAEATAEKVALGWYLDGRATLITGTHTHIPTADARVLPRGSGYHTDAGMTGPYASVLGREIQPVLARFQDSLPRSWPVATDDVRLCGTLVDFDPETGLATDCQQVAFARDGAEGSLCEGSE